MMLRILRVSGENADDLRARMRRGEHPRLPGAVRMSTCLDTTPDDIDRLAEACARSRPLGPRWRYRQDPETGEYDPDPDPRPMPDLPFDILGGVSAAVRGHGESS